MKQRRWYGTHRVLTAVIGIQVILWTLGGLIFSTHDLAWVRGEEGQDTAPEPELDRNAEVIGPLEAASRAGMDGPIHAVELRHLGDRPVYEVRGRDGAALIDARTGEAASPISEEVARSIARRDRLSRPEVSAAELVHQNPETEYREKPLPAWRIDLADGEGTHIYVEAATGRIRARRNDAWRRFDLFWMLHTMDYVGRDDFNTPWLIGASVLALLAALSGAWLWALRLTRKRGRRPKADPEVTS